MSNQRELGDAVYESSVAVVKETQSGTTSNSTRATHPNKIGVGIREVVGKKPNASSWLNG